MWDLTLLKQVSEYYIVMTPDGETHCINQETYQMFKKQNRIR